MPDGSWRGVLLILAGAATASMLLVGDTKHGGKEISWQEFQGQLLESGLVDRIIVSNKTTARIVLRQQAIPLAGDVSGGVMGNGATISIGKGSGGDHYSYDSTAGGEQQGGSGFDSGDRSSSSSSLGGGGDAMGNNNGINASSPAKYMRYPRLGSPTSGYSPYHFAIGSVESFERKLEEAQRALNIHPRGRKADDPPQPSCIYVPLDPYNSKH